MRAPLLLERGGICHSLELCAHRRQSAQLPGARGAEEGDKRAAVPLCPRATATTGTMERRRPGRDGGPGRRLARRSWLPLTDKHIRGEPGHSRGDGIMTRCPAKGMLSAAAHLAAESGSAGEEACLHRGPSFDEVDFLSFSTPMLNAKVEEKKIVRHSQWKNKASAFEM
ncbi:hypothetical protein AAFF_G00058390 [Aldrovandia affinis]|uniref:Uncharacterized protein n=1 Tax=Aldrovandia affinis TaxID=143900 RepID=A0AAD7S0I9_9TELE|nr:hypothetical protein AAFF_G00058390 [Aldrovandia affinis]